MRATVTFDHKDCYNVEHDLLAIAKFLVFLVLIALKVFSLLLLTHQRLQRC